ncbi:MAG: S8 family serine peptidase [Pseudomonadota bacterium]
MNKLQSKSSAGALALMCCLFATATHSAEPKEPLSPNQRYFIPTPSQEEVNKYIKNLAEVEKIMVALKTRDAEHPRPLSKEWQQRIAEAAGMPLEYVGVGGGDIHVFKLSRKLIPAEAEKIATRIQALPGILFAEPESIAPGTEFAEPADPLYSASQWNLKSAGGGANLPPAWDITTGKNTLVVAVIDTGVIATHPELSGRLLSGYDFISDPVRANDGGGRDTSSSDPGNWVTAAEATGGCIAHNSSWHGTRVASIIAANANNSIGIAGVDWQAKILPVRVSGKCVSSVGTYTDTDLKDAILWAAGRPVPGVPTNANPAKVINISLGRPSGCTSELQTAIDDARKKGAVVIAAVGNTEGASALQNSPANCNGVIRVAAVNQSGGLAKYSNRGEAASLSAPGGEFTDPVALQTAADGGTTTPLNDGAIKGDMVGTSFAAPHVAGVAALMLALKPKMSPPGVGACLANTARNFPTGTSFDCDNITCGTGILDAGEAVMAARATEAGGLYHTAAVKSDGTVVAWGYNGNGQLGGGETLGLLRAYPGTPIPSLTNMRDVATGDYHTVALKGDGTVVSWGYNGQGQLGNGTTTDSSGPVSVAGLTNVIAVAAGGEHTLALKSDGTVWAWGYNYFGQLGRAPYNFTDSSTPVQVYGLTDVVAIAAGGKRSLALKKDGTVWAWGILSNITDDTTASIYSAPLQVPGLSGVVAIAAGGDVSTSSSNADANMALMWDGTVYAWGYADVGVLCLGDTTSHMLPHQVTGFPAPVVSVATSGRHTVALLENGSQWACGSNSAGQLGNGTTVSYSLAPVQVGGNLQKIFDISVGPSHTIAVGGDLSVQAWGGNLGGQLGDGTQTDRNLPQQVHGAGNSGFYNAGYATSTSADLGVLLSNSPNPALVNTNLTYDLQLMNYGPNAATGISAVLSLPSQVSFVSATSGCSYANALVTCSLVSLNNAANASFQVVVKPSVAATIDASASVSSAVYDPNGSNNVAGTSTVVNATVPTDGDVPIPAWALAALGAGLLGSMRKAA